MQNIPVSVPIAPRILYFGTPVVLLTTKNPDGTANISPLSSAWALGDRVVLGLSAHGQGWQNLSRERECVVNLPSPELWSRVERIAATTGRDPVPQYKQAMGYRFVADKFALAGLGALASECVAPPRIAECPLQLEARLLSSQALSAHPSDPDGDLESCRIVEVRVERVHAFETIVVPGTSHIDPRRWSPLWYVFRHYFGAAAPLGQNFRAEVAR